MKFFILGLAGLSASLAFYDLFSKRVIDAMDQGLKRVDQMIQKKIASRRLDHFWPDALLLLSASLKSGLTLDQAFEDLTRHAPEKIRAVFSAGSGNAGSWASVENRIRSIFSSKDLAFVKAILLLSSQSGGEVGGFLEQASSLLRQQQIQKEKMKVMTAQGRMTAWIVGASPFGLLLLLKLSAPDYVDPLFSTEGGRLLLGAVFVLVIAGQFFIHRMIRLDP